MEKHGWFPILFVMVLLLSSCAQRQVTAVQMVQTQALVESVEVMQVIGKPGNLLALARGTMPDNCAQLGQPAVTPGGTLIVVILPQLRSQGAEGCAPGPIPFEVIVALGSGFAPGQYTVSINGVQAVFTLQGEPLPAPTQAEQVVPTQEPTAPPTQAATPTTVPADAVAAAVSSAQPQPTASQPTIDPETCEDKAAFFSDVSVPDGTVFEPGEKFTKTWRIHNAGTCTWRGYALVFQQGDRMGSPDPAPIPDTVAPGDTVEISLDLTAPLAPGSHFSDWLFVNDKGSTFGLGNPPIGLLWTRIGVRSLTPAGGSGPVCAYTSDPALEAEVLTLINEARQEKKLPPLKLVEELSTAARRHSEDMGCNDFVDHYGSDGSTWYQRIQAMGVRYKDASENIYAGNPQFGGTAEGAFAWWMNSQIHRDNILNPKSTQIGVGYVFAISSTYKGYYTLNFVQP